MAMSLNKENIKPKNKARVSQNVLVIVLLSLVVVFVIGFNAISSMALKDVVEIAVLSQSIPKDGVITTDMFVKREMMASEYMKEGVSTFADGTQRREIVLWSELDRLKDGVYASYYIRGETPVYWDSLSKTGTKTNSYLYDMDGELLKLDLKADEFGTMIVPGDKLNIRITYTTNSFALPTQDEYTDAMNGIASGTDVEVTELLFSEVSVLDILNKDGTSIFDIYYNLLSLPEAKQTAMLADKDFQSSISPTNILLSVTAEQADRYASIKNKSVKYMMTLLPREGSNLILEALDALQIGVARAEDKSTK